MACSSGWECGTRVDATQEFASTDMAWARAGSMGWGRVDRPEKMGTLRASATRLWGTDIADGKMRDCRDRGVY